MSEPTWLAIAREDIGVTESLGPNDSPWIRRMWAKLGGSWLLGQPWCGGAEAYWFQGAGVAYPKAYYRAKAWLDWGDMLGEPVVGCVVVFSRAGGGHVGLVVGVDKNDNLMVLGGNQDNQIAIRPFDRDRVAGYRWPSSHRHLFPKDTTLPLLASNGGVSRNEA